MNLHAIGIDLGKTVFHPVGLKPGRTGSPTIRGTRYKTRSSLPKKCHPEAQRKDLRLLFGHLIRPKLPYLP